MIWFPICTSADVNNNSQKPPNIEKKPKGPAAYFSVTVVQ